MDVGLKHINLKKIRLVLIFFAFTILFQCRQSDVNTTVTINHLQDKAVSASFVSSDHFYDLKVFTEGNFNTPVIGNIYVKDTLYTFTPIVPFSSGQAYNILSGEEVIAYFTIGPITPGYKIPEVLTMYPSSDTIPENLLKIYINFSEPMQEVGNALDYVTVTKNKDNTPLDVFLELESELWNANHTRLTLWLDPGRIKTNLIPNKEKGPPLLNGNAYTITIGENWRDADGLSLGRNFSKTYYVSQKDTIKPVVIDWEIIPPKSNEKSTLTINFKEPLDNVLAKEMIDIINEDEHIIQGEYRLLKAGNLLTFIPKTAWKPGVYSIKVNAELEDLAGNNLNHLFDVDMQSDAIQKKSEIENSVKFTVE